MSTQDAAARFGLLIERGFFDARTCERIVAEMRDARGGAAAVYGRGESGTVDERVRKATRVAPAPATEEFVRRRLLERMARVEEHFGVRLGACEEPQFLRYGVGDYFVAHQDGNTGMLRSERESRKISAVIFLNRQAASPEPGAYCGGSLVFHGWEAGRPRARFALSGEAGTLVAFRAETTHEVEPVTGGERHTIACWYS